MKEAAKINKEEYGEKKFGWDEYTRNYRKNNPDKVRNWKNNAYANHLRREGYTVIAPQDKQDGLGAQKKGGLERISEKKLIEKIKEERQNGKSLSLGTNKDGRIGIIAGEDIFILDIVGADVLKKPKPEGKIVTFRVPKGLKGE